MSQFSELNRITQDKHDIHRQLQELEQTSRKIQDIQDEKEHLEAKLKMVKSQQGSGTDEEIRQLESTNQRRANDIEELKLESKEVEA